MISRSTTVGPQQRLDFEYDYMGRRIRKRVWEDTSGSGNPGSDLKFLYDGWNLIAELNGTSGAGDAVVRTYIWGIDLSGNYQGAGGVGGLLGVKLASGVVHFATYDGNGNICGYVDGTSGQYSANYEYGPFGEGIRVSGTIGKEIPFRFSSKYVDAQTELVYYGYRYLNASMGKWLSRDPIEERGGYNLSAFSFNNPQNFFDRNGLNVVDSRPPRFSPVQKWVTDENGNQVGMIVTDLINCIGYACEAGGSLHPANNGSLSDLFKALGYDFTEGISARDCKKHCGAKCKGYSMVYVYKKKAFDSDKIDEDYKNKDVLNDPWRESIYVNSQGQNASAVDYHGLHGESDGNYTYKPKRGRPTQDPIEPFNPTPEEPDYFSPKQIIQKLCLCKKNK